MEDALAFIAGRYNYWMVIVLMVLGLYVTIARGNLIKKIIGLNLFQTSVFMLYISAGKIVGGTAPIATGTPGTVYSNPLPHVLILTAIVVGISTTALAFALIVRIRESYGTIEEDEILAIEHELERDR
ncbi:MAG TPA: cation:proton antiporter subunit C [Parvibaculum sp.]|uniref:cation:proton antiporter subunit C n=1 Tax=Parvibaculum sp. TaxID=2024848 RepID=UPI002C2AB7D3|nr:cation:proton antiporter subunit C [Parvibaculum sp.]HMM13501.1 cation:proton antiporter subunit C [Parvibaculum sp.]